MDSHRLCWKCKCSLYTQVITIEDTEVPTWTTVAGALDVTLECSDAAGITAAQAAFLR